jgi:hypothetical protein
VQTVRIYAVRLRRIAKIINLPAWQYQRTAILQVRDVLHKNGLFILTEGFQEELDNLNRVRFALCLREIKVVKYNKNLIRRDFEKFVKRYFTVVEVRHYGLYLFLSRVFHPLAVHPDEPKHDSRLNEAAMRIHEKLQLQEIGKYSYNQYELAN